VTEDFARLLPGRTYSTRATPDGLWICDGDRRAVARLPVTPGGEVSSAADSWQIAVERQGRGWVVVARELVSEEPVGCAYPRGWLKGFDLWVAPEREYRLRAKPFSGLRILRGELGEIARFTPGFKRPLVVAESVTPDPRLTLVVLLAYEATRYDEQIPVGVGVGGGGG
jgi:hypothetical protein